MDWTLDSIMDWIFRLEFRLPGVKGYHMHIIQQQSFECIINFAGCRICYQSLPTVIIYTDWNINDQGKLG